MSTVSQDFDVHGGSYLLSDRNYEEHIEGNDRIGRSDGQFMIPSNQMDDLVQNYPNDPREWENQLGLRENSLGDENIHRVDVYHPQDYEPRLPTSDLSGANDKFLDGLGKTPGGQDECVINQFPNPELNANVGRITTLDSHNIHNTSEHNSVERRTMFANIESIGGGGARAPDYQASNRDLDPKTDLGLQSTSSTNNNASLATSQSGGIT